MAPKLFFFISAVFILAAALAHFACIFIGAPAFRTMGAGAAIAEMSRRGHWYPPVLATVIGGVLTSWAAYAAAGAGLLAPLPLQRMVLVGVTALFMLRAVAFPLLKPLFPDNGPRFWWISSGICLLIGLSLLAGLLLE